MNGGSGVACVGRCLYVAGFLVGSIAVAEPVSQTLLAVALTTACRQQYHHKSRLSMSAALRYIHHNKQHHNMLEGHQQKRKGI